MPKYYEISEAAAKRAKDMNSYSDYAPGSATAGYRAMVDEAYALAEKQKAQVDPMYHDKIDALVDRYARRLAENLNERNAIDARVPSILITGGGNFPVAKKAKQNAARDRNYGEYAEIEKLLDKIRSTGRGGISADDDLAVEKLTKKLEGMESQQAMMKAVNAYYRKHKTLEGCPELTAEQVEKVKASMSQDWRKDPVPFPSYLLTNNNANIRRVRQRIEELSHKAEFVGWTFPGGEAKVNETENRLQLIFEDKPDADTRQAAYEARVQTYRDKRKSEEEAARLAATIQPAANANEHGTGYAADILSADNPQQDTGFAETRAYEWLTAYAAEYGFILRYPQDRQAATGIVFEPWHWRYVGVENALAIRASGLSLEEFIALQRAD